MNACISLAILATAFMLSACGPTSPSSASWDKQSSAASNMRCPTVAYKPTSISYVSNADLGTSRVLGDASLMSVKDETWFSNVCSVRLDDPDSGKPAVCAKDVAASDLIALQDWSDPSNPDKRHNWMHIDWLSSGKLALRIWDESSGNNVASVPLVPMYFDDATMTAKPTLGTANAVDFLRGEDRGARKRMFFVYFYDSISWPSNNDLPKSYKIEIYYEDPSNPSKYLCESEMPDKPHAMRRGSGQGGLGGGHEPPPG